MKILTHYETLTKTLSEMTEEYKITPSKFLLKQIELASDKLKQIDAAVVRNSSSGGGNYQSDNTNFSF